MAQAAERNERGVVRITGMTQTQKTSPPTTQYLVAFTLPKEHHHLSERLLNSTASFFDITGGAERREVGRFARSGRGDATEYFELVSFTVEERGTAGNPLALAKRLEGMLRSLIEAADVAGSSARVFVARGDAAL